jgi:hypothetical protein
VSGMNRISSRAARSAMRDRSPGPRGTGRGGISGSISCRSRSSTRRCCSLFATIDQDRPSAGEDHVATHHVLRIVHAPGGVPRRTNRSRQPATPRRTRPRRRHAHMPNRLPVRGHRPPHARRCHHERRSRNHCQTTPEPKIEGRVEHRGRLHVLDRGKGCPLHEAAMTGA